jgi:hypothetical protein
MVVWFTINCLYNVRAISAYRHLSCEFESRSWRGVFDTTLSDKVCQLLAAGWWFSQGFSGFPTNTTDRCDITEVLLKVVLNTTTLTHNLPVVHKITFFYFKCIGKWDKTVKCKHPRINKFTRLSLNVKVSHCLKATVDST